MRLFRAALRFEWTWVAVEFARAIEQRVAVVYCAARSELLSARALVDIRSRVVSEVVE